MGLSARGVEGRPKTAASRMGRWWSGAAGLKVKQAAGRGRGGLRAALWRGAAAAAADFLGASPEAFPGSGRRGGATCVARERGGGSLLAARGKVPLASGALQVACPVAWKGQRACSAAEDPLDPAGSWSMICLHWKQGGE